MKTNIFGLIFAVSLVAETVAQAVETAAQTTVTAEADSEDNLSSSDTADALDAEDHLTCGFVSGGTWLISTRQCYRS